MATLGQIAKRVQALNAKGVAEATMQEAEPILADRQKDQLLEGKNAKGQRIGRYRNAAYARKKAAMNPVPGLGVPDLRLTGDFYKSIFAEVRGNWVVLDATDEKTQSLVNKYGEIIFGLNKNTKAEFIRKDLQPIFSKHVREKLQL